MWDVEAANNISVVARSLRRSNPEQTANNHDTTTPDNHGTIITARMWDIECRA